MFTQETRSAIRELSGQIATDALAEYTLEECGCTEAELLAEMVLDASRLLTAGYPEADTEVKRLADTHGYQAVLAETARHVIY